MVNYFSTMNHSSILLILITLCLVKGTNAYERCFIMQQNKFGNCQKLGGNSGCKKALLSLIARPKKVCVCPFERSGGSCSRVVDMRNFGRIRANSVKWVYMDHNKYINNLANRASLLGVYFTRSLDECKRLCAHRIIYKNSAPFQCESLAYGRNQGGNGKNVCELYAMKPGDNKYSVLLFDRKFKVLYPK